MKNKKIVKNKTATSLLSVYRESNVKCQLKFLTELHVFRWFNVTEMVAYCTKWYLFYRKINEKKTIEFDVEMYLITQL